MHVRDAEQAKPHLEHNPLSLLGACYATPRRKLNDPDVTVEGLTRDSGRNAIVNARRDGGFGLCIHRLVLPDEGGPFEA